MTAPYNTLTTEKLNTIVHLHVHSEDSALDGLSTIIELILRAKEIGSPALALTDHGVMSGIARFIQECLNQKIKPIPGVEAYHTKNRLIKGSELEKMRNELCLKYKIVDSKGKPKKKVLKDLIKVAQRNPDQLEQEARQALKDYLMEEPMDLFSMMETEKSPEEKIQEFIQDIQNYLDYDNYHLVLIAMDNQGLEDLYEIVSDSHINGFYSDPRTDLTYIRENHLGDHIIATSACLGGYFAHLALNNRIEEAKAFIQECKETFHAFYLEKQATQIPEQIELNRIIDQLAIETNTPKIVTTDVHFARKEDHGVHDVLVACSMKKTISDEDRYHYAQDHYLKSVEEIRELINDEEAIANTLKIAEMVNVTLPDQPLFPKFPITGDETTEELLKKKAWQGLFQYCLKNTHLDFNEYANRLNYELDVICSEGFADYFLIEEDMINATNKAGFLTGPGRGSAAGSLVSFMLNITTVDPIEHNLLFERFLNPERAGYPDIDVDYSDEAALWVQMYLKKKYGHNHVAQIGTKGTLAARSVIRLVGKALEIDEVIIDEFAKSIPNIPNITLDEAYGQVDSVKKYAEAYPNWWNISKRLEGHVRSYGTHASGIVLSPKPLTKVVPLRLDSAGLETTQYDMEFIEKLLVKFDILKLATLNLIELTMKNAGIWGKVDINNINLNDPYVYQEIYQKLNLSGIFQVESEGMQEVIKNLKPSCFEDIGVIVALYRPGPMDLIPTYINRKFGREPVVYPFPELEPILKETYGVWVYQEQIMMASRVIGGLTLGQSDMIRKGVAKKKPKLMNRWLDLMIYGSEQYKETHRKLVEQYPLDHEGKSTVPLNEEGKPIVWVDYDYEKVPYVEGGINRGFDLQKLLELKEQWIKFGKYCFNKSHSVCYAKISVQTAWLKAYYPTEFMAALMTISEGKKDSKDIPKNVHYMKECEEMGIQILPPDINESKANWTPIVTENQKAIRFGLASIAGISGETVEDIIKSQPYDSVMTLIEKTDPKKVNKAKIINLIKAGAFDSINPNRNKLLRDYIAFRDEEYQMIPEKTNKSHIIQYERELLGTSVTIKSRWETIEDGKENIQFTGVVRKIEAFISKKGQEHARITLETNEDEISCLIFNRNWMPIKHQLIIGDKVVFKGKKDGNTLLVNRITFANG